ncbi:helix-turn-helix domain-containing protein [Halocynthiibacter namhaensis]|uniref:helix-turn-helix domain-containing protein n=1 Tax=Halocynthiibacter namhaensis TaxID=1290553 RepID=UPI000579863F|nr:helix-turn-helix transcriptional regulator [Halocynthiibacter namhaensis]
MSNTVPNNIAKLRKDHGLSQATLAGRLNMSITQLSRLERGISSVTQFRMQVLAGLFDIEPHELFKDSKSRERIELKIMKDVIVQLDEMVARLDVPLTPKQRGDLTIELYLLETNDHDADTLSEHTVDLKKFEGMVRALGR